jgi:phosphatidylinositol-3-phosphatase
VGRSRILAAVATALVAGLSQGATVALAAGDPCALSGVTVPATYSHVAVIMEENASYGKVIGSAKAPYFNQLATQCALATNYHDDASVSQPNYMAATGGFATGVGVHDNTPSIFDQAPSWIELEESMGSNCGGSGTFYKHGHDPAYWYTPLATACTLYDVGMAPSDAGATSLPDPLPAYTWITPNLCHDDHWQTGCSGTSKKALTAMDTWLSGTVQQITATPDYQAGNTLILVTFDESSSSTTTKVATLAVAGGVQPIQDHTHYDHYALLRASEEALGIPTLLGNAATANDMRTGMGF